MTLLTAHDYAALHELVFKMGQKPGRYDHIPDPDAPIAPLWPGYTPGTVEIPNGDGVRDDGKRYAHIKWEHFDPSHYRNRLDLIVPGKGITVARAAFLRCFDVALTAAVDLGLPKEFWPVKDMCALRVLDYPPGAGSARHTDFDLFTVTAYENCIGEVQYDREFSRPNVFQGELYELIRGNGMDIHKANGHSLAPVNSQSPCHRYSIVFFALPDKHAILPDSRPVRVWLKERYERSRAAAY